MMPNNLLVIYVMRFMIPTNTRRPPDAGVMLATVRDTGPALQQHWVDVS